MLTPLAEAVARERVRANCLLLLFSLAVMDSLFHDTAAEEVLGELNQELVPELPCSLAQGVDADSAYALAQLPHVSDFCWKEPHRIRGSSHLLVRCWACGSELDTLACW